MQNTKNTKKNNNKLKHDIQCSHSINNLKVVTKNGQNWWKLWFYLTPKKKRTTLNTLNENRDQSNIKA